MNNANLDDRSISLDDLIDGFRFLPPACGEHHLQAALICLHHHAHEPGVELTIDGDFSEHLRVEWSYSIDEAMVRYWRDFNEAVEQGSVGLAILLARLLTGYTVVERAVKTTGIDWWLGKEGDPLVQRMARLEISGMLSGTDAQLRNRVRLKVEQTKQSDDTGLDVYVVVVEFSAPRTQVLKR